MNERNLEVTTPPSDARSNRRWLKTTAIIAGLSVVGISVAASAGLGVPALGFVASVPGADITGHFLLIGTVAFVSVLAFVGNQRRHQNRQWLRVVVLLAILFTVDEFLQLVLPLRAFQISDLIANYCGVLLFSLVALFLRRFGQARGVLPK